MPCFGSNFTWLLTMTARLVYESTRFESVMCRIAIPQPVDRQRPRRLGGDMRATAIRACVTGCGPAESNR